MLNSIIEGVCAAIYKEFGSDYKIYKEKVSQGFTQPCFSVMVKNSESTVFLGRRYKSTNCIQINYYGGREEEKRKTLNSITSRLPIAIEYITVNGEKMHGTNFKAENNNTCFECTINYDYFYYLDNRDEDEKPAFMEKLKTNQGAK